MEDISLSVLANMIVEIYTTPTCHFCGIAKEYMKNNGIKFVEYNVLEDELKRNEMISLAKVRSVPVIRNGLRYIIGFSEDGLKKIL